MKKLLMVLVIFFAWLTVSGQVKENNENNSKSKVEMTQNIAIDSTVIVVSEKDTMQIVYFENGSMEVYMDYLYIEDITMRQLYMTHRNINKAILDRCPISYRNDFDYSLFNRILVIDGKRLITREYYDNNILDKRTVITAESSLKGHIAGIMQPHNLILWCIILLAVVLLVFRVFKSINTKSNDGDSSTGLNTG